MSALLFLIPVALFLGLLGLAGFFWAARSGQFDDPDGAAERILLDDDLDPDRSDSARVNHSGAGAGVRSAAGPRTGSTRDAD